MELSNVIINKTRPENEKFKNKDRDSQDLVYSKSDDESKNIPEETLHEVMVQMVRKNYDFPILMSKSDPAKSFDLTVTMSEYYELSRTAAKSFIKLGLKVNGAVGIMGFNHAAWCISQFGSIFAGGKACGIYTTNTADICTFIINDCSCQVIVVENTVLLAKIISILDKCPQVKALVQYTGELSDKNLSSAKVSTYTWKQFLELSAKDGEEENSVLEARIRNLKPKDTAILIYTSGTTGLPKGVMLSHDNLIWTSIMALSTLQLKRFCHSIISYLPFSHVAANLFDVIAPMTLGITVYFAQPDALKGSLGIVLKEVRPTLFFGVPRVFEKIHEQMLEKGSQNSSFQRFVVNWAKDVGHRNNVAKQLGKPTDLSYTIANCLVFTKVKEALGLDRCIYIFSGAAPLAQQTLDYFLKFDIIINQVYGMSESSGPQTIGLSNKIRNGTTGCLMKGAEMKIADPDEKGIGEICMRGRHIFLGYYNAKEKTREVIDDDGWLHSGDLGRVEEDEFLRVTGRIKELIITAGGENIAPVPIEDRIKENLPFIANVVLIGDKRKFMTCLLTLKTVFDTDSQSPTNNLTPIAINSLKEIGINATVVDDVVDDVFNCKDPALITKIDEAIKNANNNAVSNAAFVQKWSFLPKDFSIPGGELGPTMKLKRPVITDMYSAIIDKMYA